MSREVNNQRALDGFALAYYTWMQCRNTEQAQAAAKLLRDARHRLWTAERGAL